METVQPAPVLGHAHNRKAFPYVQMDPPHVSVWSWLENAKQLESARGFNSFRHVFVNESLVCNTSPLLGAVRNTDQIPGSHFRHA